MEVVASLSQGRTAAAQCGLFTYKSVPVIFEPPCTMRRKLWSVVTVEIHDIQEHSMTSLQGSVRPLLLRLTEFSNVSLYQLNFCVKILH